MKNIYPNYTIIFIVLIFVLGPVLTSLPGPLGPIDTVSATTIFSYSTPGDFLDGEHGNVTITEDGISLPMVESEITQVGYAGGPGTESADDSLNRGFSSGQNIAWQDNFIALTAQVNGWQQHPDAPFERSLHECIWDDSNDRMVVFGGQDDSKNIWTYDPDGENWTQVSNDGYMVREFSAVWDTSRSLGLIYGGFTLGGGGGAVGYEHLYDYDPTTHQLIPGPDAPMERVEHVGVWDSNNGQLLVYSGKDYDNGGLSNDLYSYKPSSGIWKKLGDGPTERRDSAGTWDPLHRKMFIFGGLADRPGGGNIGLNDLWSYDPVTDKWSQKSGGPPTHANHEMIWDPVKGRLLMYGTNNKDALWTYYPSSDTWSPVSSRDNIPENRYYTCLAWDKVRNDMILFGGWDASNKYGDVWSWSDPVFDTSGHMISSTYDTGGNGRYSGLGWGPAKYHPAQGTSPVKFQFATSDQSSGPWSFLGPDGTSSTYYTEPGTISSVHSGQRYFRYKVHLSTADQGSTPYLTNVTVGYFQYLDQGTYTSKIHDGGLPNPDDFKIFWGAEMTAVHGLMIKVQWSHYPDLSFPTNWYDLDNGGEISIPPRQYYQYQVSLSTGDPTSAPVLNWVEVHINNQPSLTDGQVDPLDGDEATVFTFSVIYSDPDGDPPSVATVFIDGNEHTMGTEEDSFELGCYYTYGTTLELGLHQYYFLFDDGNATVNLLETGTFSGPLVDAPPVPSMVANRTTVLEGEAVEFDASASSDPVGTVGSYYFDFGDGLNSGWTASPRANHTYFHSGAFKATLIVKDERDVVSPEAVEVEIKVQAIPIAKISFPDLTVEVGEEVEMDGSRSSDEDGNIVQYIFDFGDGSTVEETTSPTITHVYDKAGNYTFGLKVEDNDGLVSQEVQGTVKVKVKEDPDPPWNGGGGGSGLSSTLLIGIVAVIIIVVVVVLLLVLKARRGKEPEPPVEPPPPVPPPPPPSYYQDQTSGQYYDQGGQYQGYGQDQYQQQQPQVQAHYQAYDHDRPPQRPQ